MEGRSWDKEVKREKETVRESKQDLSLTSPVLSDSDSCRLWERHDSSQGQTYRSLSFCRLPPSSTCLLFLSPLVLHSTLLCSALFSRHLSVHLNFISQMTGSSVMQQLAEREGGLPHCLNSNQPLLHSGEEQRWPPARRTLCATVSPRGKVQGCGILHCSHRHCV